MYETVKTLTTDTNLEQFKQRLDIPVPQDQTEQYDRAIAMMELCTDKEVVLDQILFEQLIMDKWKWMGASQITNSSLAGTSCSSPWLATGMYELKD